jgi:U3 small nucleolar RNA-associated protein 20
MEGFVLQKRLKAFLGAFAAIDGPKQLVQHSLLENVFRSFLSDHDPSVVELSLTCLLKFKLEYLVPYSGLIRDMVQKGKLRSSLLKLTEVVDSGSMSHNHKKLLIPLLSRILFGRITSKIAKNSKDTPAARRAAILSFLSVLCPTEEDLFPFVYLMTRSFVPRSEKLKVVECYDKRNRETIMQILLGTSSEDLATLTSGVVEGFLHLLDSVVSQLGYRIVSWVPHFTKITLEMSNLVSVKNDVQSIDATTEVLGARRSPIRTLCFQRLSILFSRFGTSVDFGAFSPLIWNALEPSLALLPEMVLRNEGCPSILLLLQSMSSESKLIRLLENHDDAVRAVILCIAPTSMSTVMHSSLTFVENLLSVCDENSAIAGVELVRRHSPLLVEQFTIRFEQRITVDNSRAKNTSKGAGIRNSTWRRELDILFRVSNLIADGDAKQASYSSHISVLCNLLVPLLHADQGTSDEDKVRVTAILDGFVGHLDSEAAISVFSGLSRSLAPYKSKIGISAVSIRRSIASLIMKVAKSRPELNMVSSVLLNLTSTDEKRVDEIDFERVLPELNLLADQGYSSVWKSLCSDGNSGPSVLDPLINTCFHLLYCDDGVLVRASFNAIKGLVLVIAKEDREAPEGDWIKLAESKVMPLVRSGILSHDAQIRRHFILLTREISREFHLHPSKNLCGDLDCLRDDENHDLDFFLSITHVQIHRRSRAFQRLRKTLSQVQSDDVGPLAVLTVQSLSNILLPLALHPVYECKTKPEETFALEAIATLQALSRQLSWSKYNHLLWTLMSQFDRYAEQERFLVGAMCSVIDGFNFEILEKGEDGLESTKPKSSVWRSLENRLLPKLEELLTKETKDKNGSRIKVLRPPIILALVKLLQKFPVEFFEEKLPRVLSVICDALRNKDSNVRDVARNTLSRMVCAMDMKYLADVVREITITLNEGYKLHVRAAVMHSILLDLSKVYEPPTAENLNFGDTFQFDVAVPAIMDLLQEDLFGEANERRESRETSVRYVKEAGGTKSVHSVEIVCKIIAFTPAGQPRDGKRAQSSIHSIVSPLLERLRRPDVDLRMIRKVREVLSRVVIGLSNNKSVRTDQLFPFVYATIEPFIGSDAIASVKQLAEYEDDSVADGEGTHIWVSGRKQRTVVTEMSSVPKAGKVVEWRPSTLKASGSAATALEIRKEERRELLTVRDGTSAPKLTGSSRHGQIETFKSDRVNEPATISAVIFGLNLMNACLKRKEIRQGNESVSMLDPFVPMLTACVCRCRDTDVALVALKCLLTFLRLDLPSIPTCAKSLGVQTLLLLSSAGSSKNQNHDLVQACFKTLTHLITTDSESDESPDGSAGQARTTNSTLKASSDSEGVLRGLRKMPLSSEQMRVLISFLQVSITETEQHNPALGLIKAILSRRYASPEFYDMLESILKLVVRSQKANLRYVSPKTDVLFEHENSCSHASNMYLFYIKPQQCTGLFVRYLLDYPMGEERFEKHLKQVVANIGYEYQEGRLSAIVLLTLVVEKLPEELLQKHAQLLFLPLVLQLVNDDSKECRGRVSSCIEVLLKRSSLITLRTFQEYCVRWSKQGGALLLASMQVFGLIADSRSDFIQSSSLAESWSVLLENQLRQREKADWETTYFSLVAVEKLWHNFAEVLSGHPDLWTYVTDCLTHVHPWIRLSSSRILNQILSSKLAKSFLEGQRVGILFDIVRNLTSQLNVNEEEQSEEISELAIKNLAAAVVVMNQNPQMCYALETAIQLEERGSPETLEKQGPVYWLLRRLSQIVRNKGSKRRIAVFKCYAAFVANNYEVVAPYLELMLEGLHRSATEAKNEIELQSLSTKRKTPTSVFGIAAIASTVVNPTSQEAVVPTTEYCTAEDVLKLIEDSCTSPEQFLIAYAAVKRRARDKKEKRKVEEKAEAVLDPQAAAVRKIKKQERSKERKKRKSDEHRRDRGGADKKKRRSQFP